MNRLDASVLIATYNRATLLDETLTWLARMRVPPRLSWEAIVIDNNSRDATRDVVERHAATFPVRLRYLFEPQPGRSSALNTGIAAAEGAALAFTDDDVRVAEGWLDQGVAPLLGPDDSLAYTGGPVRPLWGAPPPRWLDLERGELWGTIAIQNHGRERFIYEEGRKVPLGANMAVKRSVFGRVGGFRPGLGRSNGRLVLGQEVPELLGRLRAAGFRGMYVPEMRVDHHIPAARLRPRYFRRWWFGKGVSRSMLDAMQPITELGVDLRTTPHLLGVPRYMYGSLVRDVASMAGARLAGRVPDAFRHQMMIAYFAGYAWSRWHDRRAGRVTPGPTPSQRTENVVTTGR